MSKTEKQISNSVLSAKDSSIDLISLYCIFPVISLLTAIGLFVFKYNRLNLSFGKKNLFLLEMLIISFIVICFVFFTKKMFTKKQMIDSLNRANGGIISSLIILTLIMGYILARGILVGGGGFWEDLFGFFIQPATLYGIIFFLSSSLTSFVVLFLPRRYFNLTNNKLTLRRNKIIFYTLFFILFYLPFIVFIVTGSEILYGENF